MNLRRAAAKGSASTTGLCVGPITSSRSASQNPNDIYGQAGELSHRSDQVLGRDGDHIIAGHTQAFCCDVMIPSRSYSNGCEYVFCAKLRHKSRNLEADYEGTRNRCDWLDR